MSEPKQSLISQITAFNRVYWIANVMEMFERLAYYGLRTVLPIYMVLSIEDGGPQFSHEDKGAIYAVWALVQSGLPIFTGGYADRYGYKLTVGIAIAVKIVGYLGMAYALEIAAILSGGESVGVPAHPMVYACFLAGALSLAAGTAIFKPGLQGIVSIQLNEKNSSVGWAVFYQIVNVGGFLGPFLAGWMRLMAWKYVFISCAVIVAFNYVFLLVFPEPDRPPSTALENASLTPIDKIGGFLRVIWDSFIGICEPRLMAFLVIFSGFWAMFHQLFDLLPNYVDDWIDSSMVVGAIAAPVLAAFGQSVPVEWGGNLPQEYMINLNAGMCMLLAFIIGYLTGKVRAMTAMITGIFVAAMAIFSLGLSTNGWTILGAIALFSLGELMSSPTKMRYFSDLAPPGKKGLYLGYINATGGIGWFLGSLVAGSLYEEHGDKVVLARRYLIQHLGQSKSVIEHLPKSKVLPHLQSLSGLDSHGIRELLMQTYEPNFIWTYFATIGVLSMFGLIGFDLITKQKLKTEPYLLLVLTGFVASITYSPTTGAVFASCIALYLLVEAFLPQALPGAAATVEVIEVE